MPKQAVMPVGLWTEGEQWMWNELEKRARVLNTIKQNASSTLRYVHEDLEQAIRDVYLPLRRCRRALARYAEINARRTYPAYAQQNPEEAAGWDKEQRDLRERWAAGILEIIDGIGPASNAYIEAVKEEQG